MSNKKWLKYLPAALVVLAIVAVLSVAVLLNRFLHQDKGPQKKLVQQVTLITPPPPPPPPPEQEKPPEVKEQEIPQEEMKEMPQDDTPQQSPGDQLGVDAEGGAGGDSFGLVGRPGGHGLLGGGGGYEQYVRQEINQFVLENPRLKHMQYVAKVTLEISASGEFERYDVELVSGDKEAADILRRILADKRRLGKPRPLEAASLVKLRIKSVL